MGWFYSELSQLWAVGKAGFLFWARALYCDTFPLLSKGVFGYWVYFDFLAGLLGLVKKFGKH